MKRNLLFIAVVSISPAPAVRKPFFPASRKKANSCTSKPKTLILKSDYAWKASDGTLHFMARSRKTGKTVYSKPREANVFITPAKHP